MVATLALIAVFGVPSEGVSVKFVDSGATVKVGGYRPLRAEMDGKAELVTKAPEGLQAPKYGTIKIDQKSWVFIVDEPAGQPAKLFVDTNGDGDLTNDPPTTWTARTSNGQTTYNGQSKVDLGDGKIGALGMYRFDPKDQQRAALKNTLMFYTDFGYEITLTLDGKAFTTFVAGKLDPSSKLWIDRDGNKVRSYKRETASVNEPFNFTGTTYVLKVKDGEPSLERAAETLEMAPLPPDLTLGKQAIPFQGVTTDGKSIDFPKSYSGKLVMLDFWATWCGPCIAELPNVKEAYAAWHDKGFEVLGISFDREGMAERLATFTKEHDMPWPQLYDGKFWETALGERYDVSAIPFVLLVDGDTGEILATARQLRGPGLKDFIGSALEKKNAAK